jgi:hypothetical protein
MKTVICIEVRIGYGRFDGAISRVGFLHCIIVRMVTGGPSGKEDCVVTLSNHRISWLKLVFGDVVGNLV